MTMTLVRRFTAALVSSSMLLAAPIAARDALPGQPQVAARAARPVAPATASVPVDRTAWLYTGSDIPPDAGWQFGTLPNGLRFAVRRNGVPPGQVTIRLRVDAGSLMEQPQEAGWAHLIEHLSFRESRYLPSGEARRAWQRLGVSFGSDSNASTGATATTYQLDIPTATPQSLGESVRLLSGMIREPVLSDETVNAERPIVVAERREHDGAAFRLETAMREHFFAGQLLAQRSTIGSEATLAAANAAGVRAFHARWYRPENVVIAIAGDMDPAQLERVIVNNFSDWRPYGPAGVAPDFGNPDPGQPNARVVVEPAQPMAAHLATIRPWHRVTDSIAYTQGLMLDTLATLIINRRLEERARSGARYLAAQVSTDKPSRTAEVTNITVIPLNNQWREAIDDARAIVATAQTTPPTEAEIAREFADVESYLTRELANAQNEPGTKQADDLLNAVDIGETTTSPDHALEIWRSTRSLATPDRMLAVTRAQFAGPVQRSMLISPTPIADGAAQLAAHVARAPAQPQMASNSGGRQLSFADLPSLGRRGTLLSRTPIDRLDMERWELGNGVTALVRNTNIEPNKIRIRVRWGGGRQAVAPQGGNLLWAGDIALVESGVAQLDQSQLERLVNGRQIGMAFDVDDDAFELSAETRPEDLADQLRLLATKLAAPGWQASPIQRARAGRLVSYDLLRATPMAVVENELQGLLYSGDRRFTPPTRAEVEALTPRNFRAFWEPLMRQGPVEVQIFGDVASVDLEGMLLNTFGAMPRRPAVRAVAADVRPTLASANPIVVRHNGGATQAAMVLAYPTGGGVDGMQTARHLEILAEIFNDRLFERLRDQAGASYSQAVSSTWPKDFAHGGYLFVGGLVRPEDSDLMARSARDIAAELARAPVTADELQRATGPAGERIMRASSGNVFWMYEMEGATRDPRRLDALRHYLTDLTTVTPAQIQALARQYLVPARAVPVLILPQSAAVPTLSLGGSAGANPTTAFANPTPSTATPNPANSAVINR